MRGALCQLMDTRLPVEVAITSELITGDMVLVLAVRAISGRAIDGSTVELRGEGGAVLRRSADRGWQVVADGWNLKRGSS